METIEINDAMAARLQQIAHDRKTTLHALIEEALNMLNHQSDKHEAENTHSKPSEQLITEDTRPLTVRTGSSIDPARITYVIADPIDKNNTEGF